VGPRADLNAMGKGKNLLPLPRIESRFLGRPARRLVAIPTNRGYALGHKCRADCIGTRSLGVPRQVAVCSATNNMCPVIG
jgi:hypothetical protein